MAGKKKTNGAPTRLNQDLIDKLCNIVLGGCYYETAFAHCRVPRQLWKLWIEKGHKKPKSIYGALIVALDVALANSEIRGIQVIDKEAQSGDWRAALAMLERRFPNHWSLKSQVELTGPGGGPVQSETVTISSEDRKAEIERLLKIRELTRDE